MVSRGIRQLTRSTFVHRAFQTVAPAQIFLHNWHIDAMASHLEQCAIGRIKRLLITLPVLRKNHRPDLERARL